MGMMAMLSGTAAAKEMDPEQLVDYLVEQLNGASARANPAEVQHVSSRVTCERIRGPPFSLRFN